jgi:2-oxoglutarate ferredoxin oxidoreductase subunit beta
MSPQIQDTTTDEELTSRDFESGGDPRLCPGCGHNAITSAIKAAVADLGILPRNLNIIGGIGCSGKSIAEIKSNAIHTLHGCASPVAMGAQITNPDQTTVTISGDGDSWAIGAGKMIALLRSNVDLLHICENNGTYGLTKGQLSPTTEEGSPNHSGRYPDQKPVDGVGVALMGGATFVAKGFSARRNQLVELIKAGILHDGIAYLDVMSPCVTFNDHAESKHSYDYGKDHSSDLPDFDVVDFEDDYPSEEELDEPVTFDEFGKRFSLQFKHLDDEEDYDPRDLEQAVSTWKEYRSHEETPLGIIYIDEESPALHEKYYSSEDSYLAELGNGDLRPPEEDFEKIVDQFQ